MLHAHLRKSVDPLADRLSRREDPLTSTVFERLSYLDAPLMWRLLRASTQPIPLISLAPDGWPDKPLEATPTWHLWPRWAPSPEGHNTRSVEPDAVCHWPGGPVIIFEAKHHGAQTAWQWREQLLAAQWAHKAAPEYWLVAVGGTAPAQDRARAKELADNLKGHADIRLFRLSWETLCEKIVQLQRSSLGGGTRAILHDLELGLCHFGRGPVEYMDSLLKHVPSEPINSAALNSWSPARGASPERGHAAELYPIPLLPSYSPNQDAMLALMEPLT